jgi:phosphotransferase system enzyme I (PtsI)
MIESAKEVCICKELITETSKQLSQKGYNIKKVRIGGMIETREAVDNLDDILNQLDFVSIGTNDLLNQVVGYNRKTLSNKIQEYFEPQFISALNTIIKMAKSKNIPLSVCGEMASDPLATVILIGLGAEDLSVSPSGIQIIKKTIKGLNFEVAKELTDRILTYTDINEVMLILSGYIDTRF